MQKFKVYRVYSHSPLNTAYVCSFKTIERAMEFILLLPKCEEYYAQCPQGHRFFYWDDITNEEYADYENWLADEFREEWFGEECLDEEWPGDDTHPSICAGIPKCKAKHNKSN